MASEPLLLLLSLLACGRDDKGGEETGEPAELSGVLTLSDANNFAYTGTIDAPSFTVAEHSDIYIDFSALSSDIQCHDLDPVADLDNVALLAFPYLSEAEVESGLSTDTLQQSDMGAIVNVYSEDRTAVWMSEFTFLGTDPEIIETYFYEDSATWMVLFTTGTRLGVGGRAMVFLEPSASTDVTEIAVQPACGTLDFDADLASLSPVPAPSDGDWTLNWSTLTTNAQGNPIDTTSIDSVMVAYYADLEVADLQERFLDLELLADGLWTQELSGGTAVALDALVDADGAPFPGAQAEGTWVLALRCGLCPNPAPIFLTVLDVR